MRSIGGWRGGGDARPPSDGLEGVAASGASGRAAIYAPDAATPDPIPPGVVVETNRRRKERAGPATASPGR